MEVESHPRRAWLLTQDLEGKGWDVGMAAAVGWKAAWGFHCLLYFLSEVVNSVISQGGFCTTRLEERRKWLKQLP